MALQSVQESCLRSSKSQVSSAGKPCATEERWWSVPSRRQRAKTDESLLGKRRGAGERGPGGGWGPPGGWAPTEGGPASEGRPDPSRGDGVFHELHRRFVVAHDELRERMAAVVKAASRESEPSLRQQVEAYADRLLRHHRAEDEFVFPAFRSAGRLRSSDVAFLEARDAEHRDVHHLCIELRDTVAKDRTPHERTRVARLADELAALTTPHYEAEESVLTVSHLQTLLTAAEVARLFTEIPERWER